MYNKEYQILKESINFATKLLVKNSFYDDNDDDYYIDKLIENTFNKLYPEITTEDKLFRITNPNTNKSVIGVDKNADLAKLIHPNGKFIWIKEIEEYPNFWLEDWCFPNEVLVEEHKLETNTVVK